VIEIGINYKQNRNKNNHIAASYQLYICHAHAYAHYTTTLQQNGLGHKTTTPI
jgi:hypothetical protein